ncbi:MAG: hypothetical protein ACXVEJ_13675 [Nocardioides sp.]
MTLGRRTHALRLTVAATALLALAGCGDGSTPRAHDAARDAAPRSPTSPTTSATPDAPRLIGYAGGESPGVEVQKRSDVARLRGAPDDFKAFIADTAEGLAAKDDCSDGYVGVTVQTLRTDGFAVGGVNDCGGYLALWTVVDGRWKEVAGTQEEWDCQVLKRYAVPSDVAGERCYDYDHQQELDYQQA